MGYQVARHKIVLTRTDAVGKDQRIEVFPGTAFDFTDAEEKELKGHDQKDGPIISPAAYTDAQRAIMRDPTSPLATAFARPSETNAAVRDRAALAAMLNAQENERELSDEPEVERDAI